MFRLSLRNLVLTATAAVLAIGVAAPAARADESADLGGIKTYLLEKTSALSTSAEALHLASEGYYELLAAAKFDYAAIAATPDQASAVYALLEAAKEAWIVASPLYEQMEGIVAGVPSLAEYDVILDAGASAEEDPENAVPFDLTLPDGKVLAQPGNLFGLLEATLWGTVPAYVAVADADLNADGELAFGEVLPDANMLKGASDLFLSYVVALEEAANAWSPNQTDAFTALVVMIPTMSEYFESWKQSRFVAGEDSEQANFVVISRLADIQDILSGLAVVYANLEGIVGAADAERAAQIGAGLADLRAYVAELYAQEQAGKVFTAEEADLFGGEAQTRAEALAGQVAQVAALLEITLPE
jgi:Imelysin